MTDKKFDLSSAALHIIAMGLMLLDHIWATLAMNMPWLTCVGRIAFPIFAFMIVEGYFHTRNYKKYLLRMLIFALISEVPFDLMCQGMILDPLHQNVMFTFFFGLLFIRWIENAKQKGKLWYTILIAVLATGLAYLTGMLLFLDYYQAGVLTVLVFYFFRGKKWWNYAGQLLCLAYMNLEMLATQYYIVTVAGHTFELYQQSLAVLALIPIWLYRGRQGYHSTWFKYFCYAFYPAHMLLLYFLSRI